MEKYNLTFTIEVETNASVGEIHNAVNIGVNDAFPDNDITNDRVFVNLIEIQ